MARRTLTSAAMATVLVVAVLAVPAAAQTTTTSSTTSTSTTSSTSTTTSTSTTSIPPTTVAPSTTAAPTTAAPTTVPGPAPTTVPAPSCDPSYPELCIPPGPPDVDCGSAVIGGRTDFRALPPDPHGLDRDGDGRACESEGTAVLGGTATRPAGQQGSDQPDGAQGDRSLARTGLTVLPLLLGAAALVFIGLQFRKKADFLVVEETAADAAEALERRRRIARGEW